MKLQIQVQVKKFSECLVFTHFNTDKGIKKRMSLVKVMLLNYFHFIKLTIHLLDRPAMEKLSHLLFRNINEIIKKNEGSCHFVKKIYLYQLSLFFANNFKYLSFSFFCFLIAFSSITFSNNNSSFLIILMESSFLIPD